METGCKISKALKKQKKANTYETMIIPITYITMFYDVVGFWFLTHSVSTIRIKLIDYLMVKSQGITGEEYLGFQLRVWFCFFKHPGLW